MLRAWMPVRVAKDGPRRAVGATFIGSVEKATEMRLNFERVEIVAADFVDPGGGGVFARVEGGYANVVGREAFEAVVAVAQIDIIGIRLRRKMIDGALDAVEGFGLRHIERAEDERVQGAEDDGVGADGDGERDHGDGGKAGGFAQHAQAIADVLRGGFEEMNAAGFAAFFGGPDDAAKLEARPALRVCSRFG